MSNKIPLRKTRFSENLIQCNGLRELGLREWVFHPAMLFQATGKWWGRGHRKKAHEGVDFCLFNDNGGQQHFLDHKIKIPVMYSGKIVKIGDDLLGESIYVSHDIYNKQGAQLCTIYAHTQPRAGLGVGEVLSAGAIVGAIAKFQKKETHMRSHLHLSIAWILSPFPWQKLSWETINDPKIANIFDPLKVIDCKYKVVPQHCINI